MNNIEAHNLLVVVPKNAFTLAFAPPTPGAPTADAGSRNAQPSVPFAYILHLINFPTCFSSDIGAKTTNYAPITDVSNDCAKWTGLLPQLLTPRLFFSFFF